MLGNRIMSEQEKEQYRDGSDALPTYSRSPSLLNETQAVRVMRSKFQKHTHPRENLRKFHS
jgi:hypothetical protein